MMFKYNTPEEYEAGLYINVEKSLQHHCTDHDCSSCPYNGGDCNALFLQMLPDRLRYFGGEVCLDLAVNLEACREHNYDLCSKCDHFSNCYAHKDLSYILKETYEHLVSLGIYSKRYNPFNYSFTLLGILLLVLTGQFLYASVRFLMKDNMYYFLFFLLSSPVLIYYAVKNIRKGIRLSSVYHPSYIFGKNIKRGR